MNKGTVCLVYTSGTFFRNGSNVRLEPRILHGLWTDRPVPVRTDDACVSARPADCSGP